MKDISIIVPFYNSSEYLRRCVESLCRQTISNQLELVFVNDCSTDNSEEVIREALSIFNFKGQVVIEKHKKNQGSAIARKTGIEAAGGKYILFCDSDDWIELDMCEKLLIKAEHDGCEIVVCDYRKEGQYGIIPFKNCYKNDFFVELLKASITGSLCNKLIKRSIFFDHEIIYPTLSYSEDFVISIQASYYAGQKIGYVPKVLYNYSYNPFSITQDKGIQKIWKRIDEYHANFKIVESFLESHNVVDKYRDEIIFHKLKIKNFIRNQIKYDKKLLACWRETFPELNLQIFTCKYIGVRLMVSYYATYIGLWKGRV